MSSTNETDILKSLLSASNKAKQQILNKNKKTKRINVNWKLILVILAFVTSIFVTAVSQFVNTNISWEYVGSSKFFSKLMANTFNNLFILFALFVYSLDKLRKEPSYIDERKKITDKFKNLISSILFLFLNNFNRERKKMKYKYILEKQLEYLENKITQKDSLIWLRGTEEEKNKNTYCVRKKDLLEKLDDDYIEKHIDENYIKIRKTTMSFLKYGYTKKHKGYYDPWEVESGTSKFLSDLGPKILLSLAIMTILQTIIITPGVEVQWYAALWAILLRIYPMAVNSYIGITYAYQFHREKDIVDLGIREEISKQAAEYQENYLKGKIKIEERPIVEHPIIIYAEPKGVEANG